MHTQSPWKTLILRQNGRELATYEKGNVDVTYTYNPNGLRTKKSITTSTGSTTNVEYVYEGGLLMRMTYGERIFDFSYDASGNPIGFNYTIPSASVSSYYYYGLNSRGDIEVLYTSAGSISAIYEYDAYGQLLSVKNSSGTAITGDYSIAHLNPLRYRSYVYDTETGLYYLQSRYYDPTTCRFINADVFYETGQGINGYNMFAYCNNNPVMYSDPTGEHALNESCGNPSCLICRPERREFINSHIEWYNKVTGENIAGVTDTGDIITIVNTDKAPEPTDGYIHINDSRNNSDNPNIKVWNSYLITDKNKIESVAEVLLAYDKKYPTAYTWRLSKEAIILEWQVHNDFVGTWWNDKAMHVDLDKNDETLFFSIYSLQYSNGL